MDDQNIKSSYHHGGLREVLLTRAAQLIKHEGESALSMRRLASEAGVSRTAPYHHFADKHSLLCAIAEEGFCQFDKLVALDSNDGDSLTIEQLEAFVLNYVSFAVNHSEYYDLMFGGHIWKSDGLTDSLRTRAHESFKRYADAFRHWQDIQAISPAADPLKIAQVSWGTIHGISRLAIDGIYLDFASVESVCRYAVKLMWKDLSSN